MAIEGPLSEGEQQVMALLPSSSKERKMRINKGQEGGRKMGAPWEAASSSISSLSDSVLRGEVGWAQHEGGEGGAGPTPTTAAIPQKGREIKEEGRRGHLGGRVELH